MIVPILNPLRFYAPNASRVKENNPFFLSQNYWNELNGSYQPKFLDKLQCIAYEDSLGGVYGFSDVSEFIGTPTNPRIENCKFCFDGGNAIYTNLDGATIGKVLIVKYSGTIDIKVRENTTVIHSYTGLTDGIFIHELTQNYVNLTINIEVSDPTCILGAMVVEPYIIYDTCNDTIRAYPIDICSHGGVYLINLQSNYFRQTLDFLPIAVAFGSGLVDIEITYSNGTIITGNYDNSISFQGKIDATLNLLTAFEKIVTTPTVIIRDNLITTIEFIQGVTRVIISPTGVEEFNTDCCNISIGDYESEFFTIINQQDKEFLKLQKVSYLSYFMDKDMAFSDLWEAHILVESKLIYTKGSDKEIFEGQNKNTILDDKALRLRIFRSGAIPYYLAEQLDLIFGFNLNIDGVNYVAHEQTEIEEITSNTDLFNFECILRAQDFDLDAANSLYSQAIIAFKNATLKVNGGVIKSLSSGEVWNLKVEVDGVESGTFDGIDTWEIEGGGGLCEDANYNLKDSAGATLSSGTIPSGGTDDIIAPDASYLVEYLNGTDIQSGTIPSGGSLTIQVPNPNQWQRPSEWLALPTITSSNNILYGLFIVFENELNQLTFRAGTGLATIDYGDGSAVVTSNNTVQSYFYDYATISSAVNVWEDGRNYKQVIVTVTPTSTSTQQLFFSQGGTINALGNNNFADIVCAFNNNTIRLNLSSATGRKMNILKIFKCLNVGSSTLFFDNSGFQNLELEVFEIPSTLLANLATFQNSTIKSQLVDVNCGVQNTSFFRANLSGGIRDIISTGTTSFQDAKVKTCRNILNITSTDTFWGADIQITGNVTITSSSLRRMFQNCTTRKLHIISMPSTPTNMAINGGAFTGMYNLEDFLLSGCQIGFDITGSSMSATALNALFTSLGNATGSQTITVTGNPGAATCNTSIATTKGFTVIT